MPLGKQAAAYTLASSFAMVAAKCRMLLPDLFHFSFFLALSVGSAFINTSPTFCERGGSFVFPSHSGLGGEQGPPAAKMRRCITGEPALAERKISCALRVVPPSLQAVWESLWGLNFHEIRNIKHCSHLSSRWELLCFPFPAGLGRRTGPPLRKNAPVHNGRAGPRRGKNLPRLLNCPTIAPSSLGKSMGLEFSCNLEYKTLLPPFFSVGAFVFPIPFGIGGKNRAAPLQKCAGA